jgi:DNA-binding NtrC family response regulator
VRIVAASNKNLQAMCKEGGFREDLFFRLNVITLALPPLRERAGDVAHLVRFYLARIGAELGRAITIRDDALAALERWSWPGNVRELENVIRRAAVFGREGITLAELPPEIAGRGGRA